MESAFIVSIYKERSPAGIVRKFLRLCDSNLKATRLGVNLQNAESDWRGDGECHTGPGEGLGMNADETIQLNGIRRLIQAEEADLSGSSFTYVNLSGATFKDVNFAGAEFEDANLSGWTVRNANLSGLEIGNADLRGASIVDSLTAGMTIDGIPIAELLAAYRVLTAKLE
jgi:uncharacterized protein YjbI with pentapeptide repeats